MTETAPRPRQVTLASLIAGFGALLVLLNIFAVMADWGSASIRDEIQDALDKAPFGSRNISVDTALEMVRVMLMVVAAGCVTAVVLAIFTLRRHRPARVGLTVLASAWALLSLALGLAGLLLAAIAVGCVVLLWSAQARSWFASDKRPGDVASTAPSRQPPPHATLSKGMPAVMSTPTPPDEPDQPTSQGNSGALEPSEPSAGGPPAQPGGYSGYGPPPPPPPPPPSYQPPGYQPQGYQPYTAYAPVAPPNPVVPTKRPGTLTAAGIITIVMSSIALLGTGIIALWFLIDRESMETNDDFIKTADRNDIAVDDFVTTLGVIALIGALLSIAAIVLGALLLKNKRVRIALVVLTSISIVASLVAFPLGLLWVIAEILVIVFCFVGGASAWLDAQSYAADRARQHY